jgi:hypothetical protein
MSTPDPTPDRPPEPAPPPGVGEQPVWMKSSRGFWSTDDLDCSAGRWVTRKPRDGPLQLRHLGRGVGRPQRFLQRADSPIRRGDRPPGGRPPRPTSRGRAPSRPWRSARGWLADRKIGDPAGTPHWPVRTDPPGAYFHARAASSQGHGD